MTEIKFWNDWLKTDLLERLELVKGLPIIKEMSMKCEFSPNLREHVAGY